MYVCMCTMYVCMHVHHVCIHALYHVCMHVHHACMHCTMYICMCTIYVCIAPCMYACALCMYICIAPYMYALHHVYMRTSSGHRRPEEGVRSPGAGSYGVCEMLLRCWELNLGLLEEQPVLLALEPSPHSIQLFLDFCFSWVW